MSTSRPLSLAILVTLSLLAGIEEQVAAQAGSLDPTFGTNGRVLASELPLRYAGYESVALQADGKVVVAGEFEGPSSSVLVARYSDNGALDTTFGLNGITILALPPGLFQENTNSTLGVAALAIDGNAKILVALSTSLHLTPPPHHQILTNPILATVVRLNSDGSPDTSFGIGGFTVAPPNPNFWYSELYSMEIAPSGRIIVAGSVAFTVNASTRQLLLVGFDATGALDTTFGASGLVTLGASAYNEINPWGSSNELILSDFVSFDALSVYDDGRILAVGHTHGPQLVLLARMDTDGQLDASFGTNGRLLAAGFSNASFEAGNITLDSSGRLLLGGSFWRDGDPGFEDESFGLVRLLPDGILDATFGSGGVVMTDFSDGHDWIADLVVDAGGSITAIGGAFWGSSTGSDFALARYTSDGDLDPQFGDGGLVTTDFLGGNDWGTALAVDTLGRLVVVGPVELAAGYTLGIARYAGVTTAPLLIEWIVDDVINDLAVTGLVNAGTANSLEKKLQASIQNLDKGQNQAAANQLEAFILQLEAKVNHGSLTQAQAQPLIQQANFVLSLIGP